ncbi:MAG: hypothetical protein A2521_08375 [Deltaproteobacteria bacterium RIFOXYD12_FULL_57_12]|nr:MAG: hypothetical protein A2521_08375 [Deltaproteobacteria bacterium RIFOXYD12_FULL_57_12]
MTEATIMIVDDEPITMGVVQFFLEEFGYHKFVLVDRSVEAMRLIEETCPDILLLDLLMPEVSGFEILSAVRSHSRFKHLPVIILTASSDSEDKIRALDLGASDFLAKPVDQSELGLRVRNTLAAKSFLDQLAYYDPLTSLPNRRMFLEALDRALREARRYQEGLGLLSIELDRFDRINDTIGLSAGDEVLRQVAHRIVGVIREVDLLGRVSGPNAESEKNLFRMEASVFSLLLKRIRGTEGAAIVAGRILQALRPPLVVEGKEIYVTASLGIATFPVESDDGGDLLRLASSARDYAKNNGGDTFQFSSSAINSMYEKRLSLENRLRKGVERQEFVLYYQPKVDVGSGFIRGVEALVRWDSPDGFVSPGDFIPLAEEMGLIVPIGAWVLQEACRQLQEWHRAGYPDLSMSVNLSVKQFTSPDLAAMVRRCLDESGINPALLTLEITESLLAEDIEEKIVLMRQIKEMGIKLSIDDFGTGYSSLSYLRKLPVDELKIDRSFIMDLPGDKGCRAVASTIIFLSSSLNLLTVAEGVETAEQLAFLQDGFCQQYQGFLFSKPVPASKLFDLLRAEKV